jgi:luciferase family oxidoreductase group 1
VWILGSSTYGAKLAAAMGLPYAFASHFAPDDLDAALAAYRSEFRPSAQHAEPYVMIGAGVYAADTARDAERLFTSIKQAFVALRSGAPIPLPAPVDSTDGMLDDDEEAMLARALACSFVGTGDTVARELAAFAQRTRADEVIVTSQIFDHDARKRSFEIVARAVR